MIRILRSLPVRSLPLRKTLTHHHTLPSTRAIAIASSTIITGQNVSIAPPITTSKSLNLSFLAPRRSFGTTTEEEDDDDNKTFEEYQQYMEKLSPARKKLLAALNEYQESNFEHNTPTRFFKMIIDAVDSNHDGVITMKEFETLLQNIGARDKMTQEDIEEIFEELGDEVKDGDGDGDGDGGERVISVESIEKRWTPFLHVMWKKE